MKSVVRPALEAVQAILKAVLALITSICRLFGVAPPAMPTLPQPSTTLEDVRKEYRDEYLSQ